tara:strand:+ start:1157 stop:1327 length:171 start_codon:yes stop_codon:yes gene_type:complete
MPVKFKETTKDRKGNVQNYYMRSTSTDVLQAALDNNNTQPKQKQKIRNELVRRGNV